MNTPCKAMPDRDVHQVLLTGSYAHGICSVQVLLWAFWRNEGLT